MYPDVFADLCYLIRMKTDLRNTRHMCVEEMLATFLMTVGQSCKYCHTIDTFKRSKFTASTNFHKILRALNTLAPSLMAKPNTAPPPQKKALDFIFISRYIISSMNFFSSKIYKVNNVFNFILRLYWSS